VVLYELLTRRRLFRDKSDLLVMQRITNEDVAPPSTINTSVDATLDAIVKKSLERDANRRYQTAADFAEALDAWLLKAGRQADEFTLSQWFATYCPELAPTATLTLAPSDVDVLPPQPEPTAATPSFTTRNAPPPKTAAPEATTITAPPAFDGAAPPPTEEGPEATAPLPVASTVTIVPPTTAAPPPPETASRGSRKGPLLAAAAVALVVVTAIAVAFGRGQEAPPPPPPPTPAAIQGTLVVKTVPADVPIVVGDRVVGRSPVTVPRDAGPVTVQAQFADQPVQSRDIVVAAGVEQTVEFLARVPLVVRTKPARAKVRINGELLGETPFERGYLVDPDKALALRLDPPGPAWAVVEQEVTAMPGVPLVIDLELPSSKKVVVPAETGMGRLTIGTDPGGVIVSIGREKLDETPFAERQVKAGRQVLILQKADIGLDERLPVTIPKDKTLVVKLKFERDGGAWKVSSKTIR
jgi:hypothetical protein